ncbi:hypothetical protein HNQ07_001847 [Deinococcus metalli]|uniref:FRG domain-containing protein n=1 Tax=Deinococcus metalli TaxID=1141878 RepID=A0A7W8NQZ9_9DEIO|nr:FRG domain-containing protein [Deinococcus metalli]MBB5376383.1 hypothetical protein [Deinococcus metalli]GHF44460.1 hypothetical protein GCM10017781_21210 [Deinococcus metalli]
MGVQILTPSTWPQLLETLQSGSWNPQLGRFRSPFVFRGQAHAAPLSTSLQRLSSDPRSIERHLIRAFRKYAPATTEARRSLWAWLTLGQHHGLPTRLLDWSYSPLVALHFATASEAHADHDGVVWMIDVAATTQGLPEQLRRVLAQEGGAVFTTEMLDVFSAGTSGDLPFDAEMSWLDRVEHEQGGPYLLFLEPPSLDQRIVQQSALFSMLSNPEVTLDDWLSSRADLARCVVVPRDLKAEVRDRLDGANITERTLFPDLGGLSQWLSRYYRDRPPQLDAPQGRTLDEDRNRHR